MIAATDDRAWVQAMLDVETALARAGAAVGLVSADAVDAITDACRIGRIDLAALSAGAASQATPVIDLVRQLRAHLPEDVQPSVHLAATSQDVLDTAMVLVVRRASAAIVADADGAADLLAALAREHRDTVCVGRSMLQHGEMTTYGAMCATRVVGIDDAIGALRRVVNDRLAAQLGGAVGTLAPAGDRGVELLEAFAADLGLPVPVVPWHTSRGRIGELGGALGVLTGELAAAARDVVLLSSTEIGEVRVAAPGGSSAMPHKRNPAAAVLALACAHRVPGIVSTVLAGMPQELARSAGPWQAEWGTTTELLRLAGGCAAHTATAYDGLQVDTTRMRTHVDALTSSGVAATTGAAAAFVDRALAHHDERERN